MVFDPANLVRSYRHGRWGVYLNGGYYKVESDREGRTDSKDLNGILNSVKGKKKGRVTDLTNEGGRVDRNNVMKDGNNVNLGVRNRRLTSTPIHGYSTFG